MSNSSDLRANRPHGSNHAGNGGKGAGECRFDIGHAAGLSGRGDPRGEHAGAIGEVEDAPDAGSRLAGSVDPDECHSTRDRDGSGQRAHSDPQSGTRTGAKSNRRQRRAGQRHASRSPAPSRADLYEEVTARIIVELEKGRVPWVQPWGKLEAGTSGTARGDGTSAGGLGPALPRNAVTGRRYSGINILILWGAVIEHGYASQGWLTFRQTQEAGGCVRKGERGTGVVYADRFVPEAERARARDTGEDAKAIPFLKRFTVFNVAQCEGLPPDLSPEPAPLPECEQVPLAEAVMAASGVTIRIGGERAFYAPALDIVQVPPQPAFFAPINYYRTCLHELTHATGHASRLGRNLKNAFGSKDYAREELVAEMGSAFLCAALGIVPTVRHADYLASWLDVLREDNRAIFRAASAASKSADWLLARHAARDKAAGDSADQPGEREHQTCKTGEGGPSVFGFHPPASGAGAINDAGSRAGGTA